MKLLWNDKDGGPESKVRCWGLEIKGLFSVLLLKFENGTRDAFHSHAFNSISLVLTGGLLEEFHSLPPEFAEVHGPGDIVKTYRTTTHKVYGVAKASWVLTLRGPWADTWQEVVGRRYSTLKHGRQVIA